jgi:hypothetical protein
VELPAEEITPSDTVSYLMRRVLPHLSGDEHITFLSPHRIAKRIQKLVRKLVDYIEPPTGNALLSPVRDYTILTADVFLVILIELVDSG